MYPEKYRYTKEHEWVDASGSGAVRIGITDHAQSELGDIVFLESPEEGIDLEKDKELCTVESVKAVSPIYMPLTGKVTKVNGALEGTPELLNSDPHGEGWICEIEISDPASLEGLMSAAEYQDFVKG